MSATKPARPGLSTPLEKVQAENAVDLGGKVWIEQVRRRRKLAEFADDVELEVERLTRRATLLAAKAQRLPKTSNARKKASMEASLCRMMARTLELALDGQRTPTAQITGKPHLDRAARLLESLQAI